MTPEEDRLVVKQRLKDDFPHYAERCLWVRTKEGEKAKLVLNSAQRYIHQKIEEQKAKTGRVRALILKGRQQGCSTLIEARFFWLATHSRGLRVFILTHEDEATKNLFEMAKRYYENCPPLVRPSTKASNAKELLFDVLDTGYRVATAGTKGVGRSATVQLFHGSEAGFWPNAEEHARGVMQAVPDAAGTEVILESTSNGPHGFFYDKWVDAEAGKNEYLPIFVPWFWQDEYRKPADGLVMSAEDREYQAEYQLDDEQMAWRQWKIAELRSQGQPGVYAFRREYPATPAEAFNAETPGALWKRDIIDLYRVREMPPLRVAAVACDPATTSKETSDLWGIVAGGIGTDGHAYVYADDSARVSPKVAAQSVVKRYRDDHMAYIVYESNQGGDMIPTIIHEIDKQALCTEVRAATGKRARAEPIALMYEQGRVHHVGELAKLEDEMCTWTAPSSSSPNRIDALVWLLSKLLLHQAGNAKIDLDGLTRVSPNIFR